MVISIVEKRKPHLWQKAIPTMIVCQRKPWRQKVVVHTYIESLFFTLQGLSGIGKKNNQGGRLGRFLSRYSSTNPLLLSQLHVEVNHEVGQLHCKPATALDDKWSLNETQEALVQQMGLLHLSKPYHVTTYVARSAEYNLTNEVAALLDNFWSEYEAYSRCSPFSILALRLILSLSGFVMMVGPIPHIGS
ncbi:hypothetical protein MRB53_013641 [Persea americana]|uniref:Uncharacterized protein n=1 Tax=Persea americana TaxID=3435 RepID=A0ACC2K8J9_PERAE|nr:hypothetical protein MRB53_013641 [Persea americana]